MNPEKFTTQEQEGLKAAEETIKLYGEEFQPELLKDLAGMSPEEFNEFVNNSMAREELLRKWLKKPELIEKYRAKFATFSTESLREMLKNVRGHQDETIMEDGIAA